METHVPFKSHSSRPNAMRDYVTQQRNDLITEAVHGLRELQNRGQLTALAKGALTYLEALYVRIHRDPTVTFSAQQVASPVAAAHRAIEKAGAACVR